MESSTDLSGAPAGVQHPCGSTPAHGVSYGWGQFMLITQHSSMLVTLQVCDTLGGIRYRSVFTNL